MLWKIAALVFIAGCIGGSITGLVAHEGSKKIKKGKNTSSGETGEQEPEPELNKLLFAYKNPGCDTVFAGLAGNVLLGGLAAVIYWGLYGPFSGFAVLGSSSHGGSLMEPFLTVGQLAGSIVLGIGGPGFLQAEALLRCSQRGTTGVGPTGPLC